jgi:hypothetical protein
MERSRARCPLGSAQRRQVTFLVDEKSSGSLQKCWISGIAPMAPSMHLPVVEVRPVSSHSSPHFIPRFCSLLALSLLALGGCAGSQAYVPFQQPSTLTIEARWRALQNLAEDEQWRMAESDQATYQMVAYRTSETPGVRDRIKITLLPDRTLVETGSEIEDNGRWEASSDRCPKYNFVREKVLVARIEHAAARSASAPARAPELVLPSSRSSRACASGIR